jgi:hypothetical protein
MHATVGLGRGRRTVAGDCRHGYGSGCLGEGDGVPGTAEPAPWGFESASWGFNSGSAVAHDAESAAARLARPERAEKPCKVLAARHASVQEGRGSDTDGFHAVPRFASRCAAGLAAAGASSDTSRRCAGEGDPL